MVVPRRLENLWFLYFLKEKSGIQCVGTCRLTLQRTSNVDQSQTSDGGPRDLVKIALQVILMKLKSEPLCEQRYPLVSLCFWESGAKGSRSWSRMISSPGRWPGYLHHAFEQVREEIRRKDIWGWACQPFYIPSLMKGVKWGRKPVALESYLPGIRSHGCLLALLLFRS